MPFPDLRTLVGGDQGSSTGPYLDKLRRAQEGLLDLVEEASSLSRTRPHLQEHVRYLREVAMRLLILEEEAKDQMS